MLRLEEYKLLLSCADDSKLFYFLFEGLNEDYLKNDGLILFPGTEIIKMVLKLFNQGFLDAWQVDEEGNFSDLADPTEAEFKLYTDYSCRTFEEHLNRYGYGPHEFEITNQGLTEIEKSLYNNYAKEIG